MNPEVKHFVFDTEIKSVDQDNIRVIATKEVVDRDGEVIVIDGADFTNYQKNPTLLWGHRMYGDVHDVMGSTKDWKIEYDNDGHKMLTFTPVFAKHQKAQDLKEMVLDGFNPSVSIGFMVKDGGYDPVNSKITEWEMLEVSFVPIGANPEALTVMKSKGLIGNKDEDILKKVSLYDKKSAKLKQYRKLFQSDELCSAIGYTKTGDELVDLKNIYDICKMKFINASTANQIEEEVKQTNSAYATVNELQSKLEEILSKI